MTGWVTQSIVITHVVGLHARPSVKLTKMAKTFTSVIEISDTAEEPWINAKSIVKVMAMRVKQDTVLHIRASGNDAAVAVVMLVNLIMRDFDEASVHAVD